MKSLKSSVLMYEQQLEHLPLKNMDNLKRRVESLIGSNHLKRYAMIIHDKDVNEDGEDVEPHVHLVMEFSVRVNVESIAKCLEDEPQQIEIMTKRGNSAKTRAENSFMYLLHRTKNSSEKFQYSPDDVISNFHFKSLVSQLEMRKNPEDILDDFANGDLSREEASKKLMTFGARIYSRDADKLAKIDKGRQEIEHRKWLEEKKKSNESIKTVWLYGPAGLGKTRYAQEYAEMQNIPYFKSGSSNDPFEGYAGERIMILDELRPDSLPYQDLLSILDPMNFDKKTKARYHNAFIMADTILVTTPFDPFKFYLDIKKAGSDDSFEQLKRRLGTVIKFTADYIIEEEFISYELDKAIWKVISKYRNTLMTTKVLPKAIDVGEVLNFLEAEKKITNDSPK